MIKHISIVSVFVKDQDEAKQFYTDVLGFKEQDDVTLGEGYRWCTVTHPAQPELLVSLAIPGPPMDAELVAAMKRAQDAGGLNGLGLSVDDCHRAYDELVAKGVEFVQPPTDRPYGVEAVCRDNSGNWMVLVEQKAYTAEDLDRA